MAFKDTFLRLRKERGWTQQQVSDRIAVAYGVSADKLVFDDGKGVAGTKLDPGLLSRFEKVAQLPEEEKNAVLLLLLDSVIAKHTIRKVMGS